MKLKQLVAIFLFACCVCAVSSVSSFAAPLTPGNVLAAVLDTAELHEYTTAGVLVQSFNFPDVDMDGFDDLRDIVVSDDLNVQAFNGTFDPYLSTLDPASGTISNQTFTEWSTVNNITYGGIGSFQDYVFVTDMNTAGGAASGIIRFDMTGGTNTRFSTSQEYQDLTIGRTGLLYGLRQNGDDIDVFNPVSLAQVDTITFDATLIAADVRGIAVDVDGAIYAVGWDGNIYRADTIGALVDSVSSTQINLTDIDIDDNGNLVVGSRFGSVFLTDTSLDSVTSFITSSRTVHVAFTTPLTVPEPTTLAMALGIAIPLLARRR